jgi:hypothetical protein
MCARTGLAHLSARRTAAHSNLELDTHPGFLTDRITRDGQNPFSEGAEPGFRRIRLLSFRQLRIRKISETHLGTEHP